MPNNTVTDKWTCDNCLCSVSHNILLYSYLHLLFFIQIEWVQLVRQQLCFSGLSSEVQPLPSERAGPELQQPAGLRSETALCWTGESRLRTRDSQVKWIYSLSSLSRFNTFQTKVRSLRTVLPVIEFYWSSFIYTAVKIIDWEIIHALICCH